MRAFRLSAAIGLSVAAAWVIVSALPAEDAKPRDARTVILSNSGYWRAFYVLAPPLVRKGEALERSAIPTSRDTKSPPANWRAPDFDDSAWHRCPGIPFPTVRDVGSKYGNLDLGNIGNNRNSPETALLCLRGKFLVPDTAKAAGLVLSVEFRGGLVVYVNGREAARSALPAGEKLAAETPGDDYPANVFLDDKGDWLKLSDANLDKLKGRTRRLADFAIPANLLRKGVNVLALEIHRAAYPDVVVQKAQGNRASTNIQYDLCSLCDLVGARLEAASGVVPNAARPAGAQVWNSDVLNADADLDWGDPAESLRPIVIVGARNGAFSGKVVLGSTSPIAKLACSMSDLVEEKGGSKIPAAAVRIRYATATRQEYGVGAHYASGAKTFDALLDAAPAEVPLAPCEAPRVPGAVQPVWLTVKIPRDAAPGRYAGTLTISLAGAAPISVPVTLRVCGWTLPDPVDYRTFAELVESPESVAMYYGAPLWSDRHFELMARSLDLLGRIGSKTTYIHLIAETNHGNSESMVRWVRKGDGAYDYDFSVMDRWLDLVEKHQGKPAVVCLYLWDRVFLGSDFVTGYDSKDGQEARKRFDGKGPQVTVLDPAPQGSAVAGPATGKTENVFLPPYGTPESEALWRPLLTQIRERLKKRGLDRAMMLGIPYDGVPSKEMVAFFSRVAPGTPWVRQAHPREPTIHGVPVGYGAGVGGPFAEYPVKERRYGWKQDALVAHYARNVRNDFSLTTFRMMGEMNVAGGLRGFGRMGADFWPVLKDRRGRTVGGLGERYPHASWRNLDIFVSLLAPGPDGAVATARYEMMREGVQECEARIFIERAIVDKKISGEFLTRCRQVLDERVRTMVTGLIDHTSNGIVPARVDSWWTGSDQVGHHWYLASNWPARSEQLYALAAEVSRTLSRP